MAIEKSVPCDLATCKLRERSLATTATKTNGQIAKRTLAVPDFAWLIVSIPSTTPATKMDLSQPSSLRLHQISLC